MSPFSTPSTQPASIASTPPATGTPGIAIWAYILSFLFSPVGLYLSIRTLKNHRDSAKARKLAYFGIVVSALYLVFFILWRWSY